MTNIVPVKLAYRLFEPASGTDDKLPPIIYMHGLGGCKENWTDISQAIADKTKRISYALDARNHGDSEYTDEFNIDASVDDLFHFMHMIQATKAVLVGQSMGGIIAIKSALRNPERVEAMFSEDMYVRKLDPEVLVSVQGMIALWLDAVQNIPKGVSMNDALLKALDYMYSKIPPNAPVPSKESMINSGMKLKQKEDGSFAPNYNIVAILNGLQNPDGISSDAGGCYEGPSFFIYGGASPFQVGKEEANIRKHFPRAELIEFEGASHNLHPEFPEKFIATIVQRLK